MRFPLRLIVLAWCLSGFPAVLQGASPEAETTVQYLRTISGHHIVSGQHNYLETPARFQNSIRQLTGTGAGLWGGDFGYGHPEAAMARFRQDSVDEAKKEHATGRLVTFCYHEVKPSDPESAGWKSVQGHFTDQELQDLVTPGTALYNRWLAQVDGVAHYLQQLKQAGVPVLWRPYHEGNAPWFWWGGHAAIFRQLWINLHDRYVKHHGLDNLIWVLAFDQKGGTMRDFYPGDAYVDVVGLDLYHGFEAGPYHDLRALAPGKPVAITECGALPDMARLQKELPDYCYFLLWPSFIEKIPPADLRAFYQNPWTVNCPNPEGLPLSGAGTDIPRMPH